MFRFLIILFFFSTIQSYSQHLPPGYGCRMHKHNHTVGAAFSASFQDSIHVQHYEINIDSLNFQQQKLWASTKLTFQSKVDGLSAVKLSLDGFTVDSVLSAAGNQLNFNYDNLNLNIDLPSVLNENATDTVEVFYRGTPAQDDSWGGFYWSGLSFAFNMGVGFDEDPHVFGRAWFPCLDVFTDRSTYDFHIKVTDNYQAFCNGELTSIENHGNGTKTYHWILEQPIPTYLASMAVAEYEFVEETHGGIPVTWAAVAQDTSAVSGTFQHMTEAIDVFTSSYGPYQWNKIGYALVPFNAGAMEHASSIHIGRPFVDGTLAYESLWVHELSHMWWGDLVTCKDQENMWLNEGFASYSEALFIEQMYGEEEYKDWIREYHRDVLQFAHVKDGDYHAMNDVPHSATYGTTVYDKGPQVIHTLRNFMGDSLFFEACRTYMDTLAFGNANSHDLRDIFAASSAIDLNPFFDGWVFQPGFPHWQIDSYTATPIFDAYNVELVLRQKQRGNNHTYGMKVPINFTDGSENHDVLVDMNQEVQTFNVTCPFEPKMVTIDRWETMSDAIADFEKQITSTGTQTFNQTNVSINVSETGSGTSIVRIEDHFIAPDGFAGTNPGIALNPYHYWSVDGLFADGFESNATFKYNGTTNTNQGYMDNDLIIGTEDSLVLLYRQSVGTEWQEVNSYELLAGTSVTNKIGTVRIDTLKKGEYVLGRRDFTASTSDLAQPANPAFAYPNPNNGVFNVSLPNGTWALEMFSLNGEKIKQWQVSTDNEISAVDVAKGQYIIRATNGKQTLSQSVIIR